MDFNVLVDVGITILLIIRVYFSQSLILKTPVVSQDVKVINYVLGKVLYTDIIIISAI